MFGNVNMHAWHKSLVCPYLRSRYRQTRDTGSARSKAARIRGACVYCYNLDNSLCSHIHACTHTDLWVLLVVNLVVSIAGAITATSIGHKNVDWYLTTMGIAIVYLIIFCPGAFFCWFLPVYCAFRFVILCDRPWEI